MRTRILTTVLAIGLFFGLFALVPHLKSFRMPGNQQGYEPKQTLAFSHRLHAGELQISCQYCHTGVEKSRRAGIPSASICMNCHKSVTAPLANLRAEEELAKKQKRKPHKIVSAELQKLYDCLGLDDNLVRDPKKKTKPLVWVKVHNLPDYVYFDHRSHIHAGVQCQRCHGEVATMERVRQVEDLSMGWCVNCHREVNRIGVSGKKVRASNDCATCHY